MADEPVTCLEVLDLLTDYLESVVSAEVRARVEDHLAECDDCEALLDRLRATIHALGGLAEEHAPPDVRDRLLEAFRSWHHDDV